jgi:hypothetical protein
MSPVVLVALPQYPQRFAVFIRNPVVLAVRITAPPGTATVAAVAAVSVAPVVAF